MPGPGRSTAAAGGKKLNPIEFALRHVDRFQQRHGVLGFPYAVLQKFGNDRGGARAALIAYYGLFAVFPLLLLFTTAVGFAVSGNPALRARLIDSAVANFPVVGAQLKEGTHPLHGSGVALAVGILGTLYGTLGLGQSAQSGLNGIWNIPYVRWPSFYLRWVHALGVIALLGVAVLASTALTVIATSVTHGVWATALALAGSSVLNFGLFMLAYMVMTAVHLRARDVLPGAVLATIFWEVLQIIGTWYVARSLAKADPTYGLFAVVIALVSWIYLGAHLFLLAAEANVVRHYHLWPRTVTQPPLIDGDRRTFEMLGRMEVRRPEMDVSVVFLPSADENPLADRGGEPEHPGPGEGPG